MESGESKKIFVLYVVFIFRLAPFVTPTSAQRLSCVSVTNVTLVLTVVDASSVAHLVGASPFPLPYKSF